MIVDQHELRVYSGSTELEPLETAGTLTADRGWSPFVQGTLSVRSPASDALTAPGSAITIELTQRFGDFGITRDLTDLHAGDTTASLTTAYAGGTTADLTALLTGASWNTPARAATGRTFQLLVVQRTRTRDVHELQLESIESEFQNALHLARDVNNEGIAKTITAGSLGAMTRSTFFTSDTPRYPIANGAQFVDMSSVVYAESDLTVDVGASPWNAMLDLVSSLQRKLFSRGDRSILLTDNLPAYEQSLTVDFGVNLLDWQIVDDRPGNLIARWSGTATNPAARPVWTNREGAIVVDPFTRFIEIPVPLTWPPAGVVLTSTSSPANDLNDRVGLDRSPVRLSAINDYSVMPGSDITYTLPDESPVNDSIDAITWQLGGRWEMDIWV